MCRCLIQDSEVVMGNPDFNIKISGHFLLCERLGPESPITALPICVLTLILVTLYERSPGKPTSSHVYGKASSL